MEMSGTPRCGADDLGNPVLVGGPLKMIDLPPPPARGFGPEFRRRTRWRPTRRCRSRRCPEPCGCRAVEVELGATDTCDQRVAVGPGGDREVVVCRLVELDVGRARVAGGGEHGHVVGRLGGVDVGRAQVEQRLCGGERLLGRAEALADDISEVVVDDVLLGGRLSEESRLCPRSRRSASPRARCWRRGRWRGRTRRRGSSHLPNRLDRCWARKAPPSQQAGSP